MRTGRVPAAQLSAMGTVAPGRARADDEGPRNALQLLQELARLQGIAEVAELARYVKPGQKSGRIERRGALAGHGTPAGHDALSGHNALAGHGALAGRGVLAGRSRERADADAVLPPSPAPASPSDLDWRRPARLGFTILAVALGGGGAWAALARLDGAAIAPGVVAVESRRKTVQHLEGGIVRAIHVRDGDSITQGQLLLSLDKTQAAATLDTILNQRAAALAEEARLVAERDGDTIAFPPEVADRGMVPIVRQAMEDQRHALEEATARFASQRASLAARLRQAQEQRAGSEQAHRAALKQLHWLDRELPALRRLYSRGLVQWPRITTLERQRAETEGVIGQTAAAMAQNAQVIRQAELDLIEAVGRDVAERLSIRAPQSGVVQSLKVTTLGAVIKPGEALLDIAPVDEPLVVQARIDPRDMGVVTMGLKAEIQFPTFQADGAAIFGRLRSLSNDSLLDDASGRSYFAAEVEVDPDKIPRSIAGKLRAGLPAEVFIVTGERTPLSYLLEPLTRRLATTMRER
ncbi:HlyD family efflux transporter periplasmic adaptor subunit [Chelatococcus asaccharovorans]|uniref:HlyD family secretion protein n=1 Tax=Chelatococcus asaccharovorans TaxID=28210 RepID=A0A2V3TWN2_9HYPH|nr:HlyD family efflux transporter periplasmic adaptor subunit [Chelatococcus asaccharovorans]MBS7704237.1 HlyD family efflux transporter periplasmic adaptor subunit [Chelatococcus asaccharovorans]PXW53135.1 HlyD family secretion protein [Chelatococcus asaccharovorans]